MATVRKLSAEEIQTLESQEQEKGKREVVKAQYDQLLGEFTVGDYIEVELDEGEKPLSVHYHLRQAAARRGLAIDFIGSSGNVLEFHLKRRNPN